MPLSTQVVIDLGAVKTAVDALLVTCDTEAAAKDLDGSVAKPNDWSQARDHVIRYMKRNATGTML